MKRHLSDPSVPGLKSKISRIRTRRLAVSTREMVGKPPDGGDHMLPGSDGEMQDATDDEEEFNIPTFNRFKILRIPIAEPNIYHAPKPPRNEKPPEIVVYEPLSVIRELFPVTGSYGIKNHANGVKLYCNTIAQHKSFIASLQQAGKKYNSWEYKSEKTKRFVLYGLNNHPTEDIISDLNEYGIKPTNITTMIVKKPRYEDHATYMVHYPSQSNITLDIVKKAYVIRNTIVRWAHYKPNGDGLSSCSNCTQFGHSKQYCGLPAKCGICSGPHVIDNCPLIANKRKANATSIAEADLKCPHCSGKHTGRYLNCPARIQFMNDRLTRRPTSQKFVNAPAPTFNAWNYPTPQQSRPQHRNKISHVSNQAPRQSYRQSETNVFKNPHYALERNSEENVYQSTNNNSHKFNPSEIFSIFHKIIKCIEQCNTKQEQFETMIEIMSEHYLK